MAAATKALVVSLLSIAMLPAARAQQATLPAGSANADKPYTLHVYTDLVQIPALVMNEHGEPAASLTLPDFDLQLDSGPHFRATALHMEGAEPLNIALVFDASGSEQSLLDAIGRLPGHGVPGILLPHDHISLYAFDCRVIHTLHDEPASDAGGRNALALALASPVLHRSNDPKKTCRDKRRLWDAVAVAAFDLSELPGRRAMLVLSDGEDDGSTTNWHDLADYAVGKSVAIFALRDREGFDPGYARRDLFGVVSHENTLQELTTYSGGLVLSASPNDVGARIDIFVALLRSRYILQFPRPINTTSGRHHLDVHIVHRNLFVRAAGITVPLRDPALASDPTTVPADPSRMPVLGKRKPID